MGVSRDIDEEPPHEPAAPSQSEPQYTRSRRAEEYIRTRVGGCTRLRLEGIPHPGIRGVLVGAADWYTPHFCE